MRRSSLLEGVLYPISNAKVEPKQQWLTEQDDGNGDEDHEDVVIAEGRY